VRLPKSQVCVKPGRKVEVNRADMIPSIRKGTGPTIVEVGQKDWYRILVSPTICRWRELGCIQIRWAVTGGPQYSGYRTSTHALVRASTIAPLNNSQIYFSSKLTIFVV
jgi:hypothetical protein